MEKKNGKKKWEKKKWEKKKWKKKRKKNCLMSLKMSLKDTQIGQITKFANTFNHSHFST